MQPATVSVIIPVYNSELYVADAIRSVLAQSYHPHEIIVVDDGSTDGTARAIEPFRRLIRYLRQENRGEPAARNSGIREATGEYIAFLDADDLWVPEKLELQMAYLAAHPEYAFVYSDMSTFDENGIIDPSVKVRFNIAFPRGNIFRPLFRETLFCPGTVVFRKACVNEVGFFDEKFLVGCDYEMFLRISRSFQGGVVDRPLLLYRQHSEMVTRRLGRAMHEGTPWEVMVLEKIMQLYPEAAQELGKSVIRQRLSKPYADLAHTRLQLQDHRNARTLFGRAVSYWPGNWRYWFFYLVTFLSPAQMQTLRKVYRKLMAPPESKRDRPRSQAAAS